MDDQRRFAVTSSGITRWVPDPGELVTDTAHDRVGKMVAWDGQLNRVTLRPLNGGDLWDTTQYRPPTPADQIRARNLVLTRERRGW
ncbi:hypothetical protein QZH56_11790 [Streptomyces olivoreticuli]|uniref:hypothetical protein n=1 Tax=Streptomyces olivoreticuli TaxID=68246 RepID=UPI00265B1397|nr:hypothetical protein [Streptomyces olivoreticuli]WKK21011.1 hypothetical protein QZH56_19200 [Streptomyces olivoreticuli]WKK26208.1 hypothetical protein QZH56_11790 [Streptomyces olivoreticuli]